ncbi:MAG TPA: hypothetical protein ENN81_12400 [Phycisphaerales bacterium]|nr:hypothetical protein [Phycisphaerales bacterium]
MDPEKGSTICWVVILLSLACAPAASANILLVDADAVGANNGSSWANAYKYLQDALAAAKPGDEIRVAQGIYKPDRGVGVTSGDRNASFRLSSGVAIRGGYAGYGEPDPDARDFGAYHTILSGDLLGNDVGLAAFDFENLHAFVTQAERADNSYSVVTAVQVDHSSVLEGLVIASGHADHVGATVGDRRGCGAGLFIDQAAPVIEHCIFVSNAVYRTVLSARGAAVYVTGGAIFRDCLFIQNVAFGANTTAAGGAVFHAGGQPLFEECRFYLNRTLGYDSDYYGGAVYSDSGRITLADAVFIENSASFIGGAVYGSPGSVLEITGSVFERNTTAQAGGALYGEQCTLDVEDCVFVDNAAAGEGGAVGAHLARITLVESTFTGNEAQSGGAVAFSHCTESAVVTACRFEDNVAGGHGGALYAINSEPAFTDCEFVANGGRSGGAVHFEQCAGASIVGGAFTGNVAVGSQSQGGAIASIASELIIADVRFTLNQADAGGAVFAREGTLLAGGSTFSRNVASQGGAVVGDTTHVTLGDSVFVRNQSSNQGGAVCTTDSGVSLVGCSFTVNTARKGGAVFSRKGAQWSADRCYFLTNAAVDDGGALALEEGPAMPVIRNSLIAGNVADDRGGAFHGQECNLVLTNVTIAHNTSSRAGGLYAHASYIRLNNCIVWGNSDNSGAGLSSQVDADAPVTAIHCCIQNHTGQFGVDGNINLDPVFANPLGRDYHLKLNSPCIDAGDNALVGPGATDLDGRIRIVRTAVDMGCYEFPGPFNWYVSRQSGSDTNAGWRIESPFQTIAHAMELAARGDTVLILPGVYTEEIRFNGKAVTVQGLPVDGDIARVRNPEGFAVSFYNGEGPDSVVRNLIVADSLTGVFVAGSAPSIQNLTIVNNAYGIGTYVGGDPNVRSCIFYNNIERDFYGCDVTYSRTQRVISTGGNITADPLFADAAAGDYHLRSRRGRFRVSDGRWVLDTQTSPCVDAGDPSVYPDGEKTPHGGRLNMGAFGGTAYASMSEWSVAGDANYDGKVDFYDFAIVLENWLADVKDL